MIVSGSIKNEDSGMHSYTMELGREIYDIYPEDDNYTEEILRVVKEFRSFGKGMDSFFVSHGYTGDVEDRDEKITWLSSRFKQAGIKVPRNMKKWFQDAKEGVRNKEVNKATGSSAGISRETAYQICFAFQLSVEETEDFFRRICLKRGFDIHNVDELIYFYALAHRMSYAEAGKVIEQVSVGDSKRKADFDGSICYTAPIKETVENIRSTDELVVYIRENREKFGYHNVTAYEYIHKLWEEIVSEKGLAAQEKKKLYYPWFEEYDKESRKEADKEGGLGKQKSPGGREKKTGGDSIWGIYLQILGLVGSDANRLGTDRSLKPVLKDNELLHPFAEDCFPDRNGLTKILNREPASYETIRKILILLVFYKFWVCLALKTDSYHVTGGYEERCISSVDNYLADAGYPLLYAGNPFDWIILYASAGEYPLLTFRDYMRKVFYGNFKPVDLNEK